MGRTLKGQVGMKRVRVSEGLRGSMVWKVLQAGLVRGALILAETETLGLL